MNTHTNHIVICGYSAGSRMLLSTLRRERDWGSREVILFGEGERPHDIPPVFNWIPGDPTKKSELVKVRLTHAHSVILVGDRAVQPQQADATTILSLFTIRRWMAQQPETVTRKVPLYIVAEILDVENVTHAKAAGASEVIESTLVSCSLLAHAVSMPGSAHALSRIAEAAGNSLYVGNIPPEVDLPKNFSDLGGVLRKTTGLMLVGVMEPGGEQRLNPPDELPVRAGDQLVYLATGPVLPG